MAHAGQKFALGISGRFGGLFGPTQFQLDLLLPGDIFDRAFIVKDAIGFIFYEPGIDGNPERSAVFFKGLGFIS